MKIAYTDWKPNRATERLLENIEAVVERYEEQGYTLTLRQLYYRLVASGIIENKQSEYKKIVSFVTKARESGRISWLAIEDRHRNHQHFLIEEDVRNPVEDLPNHIQFDLWARQQYYVEVWVEKDALGSVIERACSPFRVPYMTCKGYLSASEAWRASMRFAAKVEEGKQCVLIHLGDHDPSGIDMTRDNDMRLAKFDADVDVRRIALNMPQIRKYDPPPNPAKMTDTRAKDYVKRFGSSSWELDALEPAVLVELIKSEIRKLIDGKTWDATIAEEKKEKARLQKVGEHWAEVDAMLEAIDNE